MAAAGGPDRYPPGYRAYFLILLATISAFAVIDRVALLTVGQAVKQELHLSDVEFGLISGFAFAVVYTIIGLPLARIAETRNRVRLICIAVAVWSVFAFVSGLAQTFLQLMICRIVIGIGEAGVQPPAIAIVSDLYSTRRRGTALAVLSVGLPVGTLAGALAAGYLADLYSWRTVFLLLGVPGIVLAMLAAATLKDPPRGLSDAQPANLSSEVPRTAAVFRHLLRRRSFRHLVVGLALTYFAAAGIGSFIPQYFARVLELPASQSGLMFGLIGSISSLVGNLSGGMLVDWISRRDERWYCLLPASGLLLGAPLYLLAFAVGSSVLSTGLLTIAGICMFLHYAPSQAVLQNLVEPRMRATAAFIFFFVVSMLGYGRGPVLLGTISDLSAAHAFPGDFRSICVGGSGQALSDTLAGACHVASAHGMRKAMLAMSCLFFWAALHFFLAARTLRDDLQPASPSPAS